MKSDTHILKIFLNNIEAPSIIIEENQKIVEYNIFAKKIFSNIKTKLDIKKIIGAGADELIKSLNKLISADSNKTETITLKLHEIDYNLNISKFQLSDKDYFLIKLNSKEEIKESSELQKIKIFTDEIEDFIESKEIFLIVELIKQSYPFTFISRQRFRRQIDKLNYGFWIKDTNGRFVIVNKMYTESVGIKQNEIEGKHEGEILRKDEYDVFKNIDSYIINTSNSVVFETYSRSSEKEILQNVEFPVCDIDDKVVAIIGFNQIARNEKVLKEKLKKLEKDKIKNIPLPVVEISDEFQVISFSDKFTDAFNLNPDKIIGKIIQDLLGKDIVKPLKTYISKRDRHSELKVKINNDYYKLDFQESSYDKEIRSYFISFSKSIKSQIKTDASKTMYDVIMHTSPEAIFIYDIENLKFLEVNDSALNLYGYRREEFLEMDLTDLYAPEDIQTLVDSSTKSTTTSDFTGPWRHKRKDGSTIMVEISKSTLEFKDKRAHLNIVKNVSEKLEEEKKLQQFKSAFDNTSDLIIITDSDGFITFANEKVTEILGYSTIEIDNKPFLSLVSDGDRAKINSEIFHSGNRDKIKLSAEVKKSSGDLLKSKIIANPIFNYENEVETFSIIIFPKKESEVIQPAPEIIKESVDSLDSEFLSNLFHEILTPINVIIGFGQDLTESVENPDEEQKESLDIIKDNQRIILQLMDNAVEYSQIQQNKIKLEPSNIHFVELIDKIENATRKAAEDKNIDFAYGKISSSLQFETDIQRLITLVILLVDFAIRGTKKERIYLSAYQIDPTHCVISVKDDRSEISEGLLKSLEEIFTLNENEIRRKYGISRFTLRLARKLGYLLAERREVIKKYDNPVEYGFVFPLKFVDKIGTVSTTKEELPKIEYPKEEKVIETESTKIDQTFIIQSKSEVSQPLPEQEKSINVNVNLQTPQQTQHEIKEAEVIEEVAVQTSKSFSELSCLYVEDQVDSQILFKVQMKDLKSIEFANSFERAIPLLQTKKFDFIVMDINLQGEYNGLDALRAIQHMSGYEHVPVIAVTAYVLPGDREKFIAAGFKDFIAKPILRDKLEDVIKNVFA